MVLALALEVLKAGIINEVMTYARSAIIPSRLIPLLSEVRKGNQLIRGGAQKYLSQWARNNLTPAAAYKLLKSKFTPYGYSRFLSDYKKWSALYEKMDAQAKYATKRIIPSELHIENPRNMRRKYHYVTTVQVRDPTTGQFVKDTKTYTIASSNRMSKDNINRKVQDLFGNPFTIGEGSKYNLFGRVMSIKAFVRADDPYTLNNLFGIG